MLNLSYLNINKSGPRLLRTTVGEYLADVHSYDGPGIYVIACYPMLGCLYVGISQTTRTRIIQHIVGKDSIGAYLVDNMAVACSWRVDVIQPGDGIADVREWLIDKERRLISRFHPLLNTAGTAA